MIILGTYMKEKCGIGGININPTHYNKGKKDLIKIKIKIKDEKLKRHMELLDYFIEVQKQEFYKAIDEILKKP